MDGSEIRRAREAARLGQIAFARKVGVPRSRLQRLERNGKVTVAALERVIAHLPNLQVLTLGGVTFVAIDRVAAAGAIRNLIDDARRLQELLHVTSSFDSREAAGATRVDDVTGVDEATRRRVAAIDAAIERGEIGDENDS